MDKTNIIDMVKGYYAEGYHCAESVAKSILVLHGESGESEDVKGVSVFCGGVGKCKEDLCGALSGGIYALGLLYGREKADGNLDKACLLAREFRSAFMTEFRSTSCKDLIPYVEKSDSLENCRDLSAETAVLLDKVIRSSL